MICHFKYFFKSGSHVPVVMFFCNVKYLKLIGFQLLKPNQCLHVTPLITPQNKTPTMFVSHFQATLFYLLPEKD